MTYMPVDLNNVSIPALALRADGAHKISAGAVSARNAVAFNKGTRVVSVYASEPVYIAFGGTDVTASSAGHYFPAGVYYNFAIGGGAVAQHTHVAVLAVSGNGNVYISETV